MPLRDHFRPPLTNLTSWEGVLGGWPMVIVQHLGRTLPNRYVAEPRVHLGSQVEVDVATIDRAGGDEVGGQGETEELHATAWAPAQPTLAVETELADPDDRPESRGQFVAKCAALLRQRVSIVIVDLVTVRDFNLYAELLALIGEEDSTIGDDPPGIYAVSCRWRLRGGSRWLEAWSWPPAVGEPLPVLPLWLSDESAIPLDLEASYEQTCRDLRIR